MLNLFAAALAAGAPCPADLLVAAPRASIVRSDERAFDHEIVTVDVRNRGDAAQSTAIRQHLELVRAGAVIGSQPIPPLGPRQRYVASFRLRVPHEKKHVPTTVVFRYVLDDRAAAARNDCDPSNDLLTATI